MPSPYIPPPPRPNRTFSGINISSSSSSRKSSPASGPIEASSLSSITPIADDPPLQFIVPPLAETSREGRYPKPALVLYLVRVPGKKDVFLTSMHPLKWTVTAQDVEGCLYYVHVHGEGEGPGEGGGGGGGGGYGQGVQGGRPKLQSMGSSGSLGSRRRWSAAVLHRSGGRGEAFNHFSMTVIRRDPATGAQWNVAHISSTSGVQMLSQSGPSPPPPVPPPIVISLPGRGYRKFIPPSSSSSVRRKPLSNQQGQAHLQHNFPPLPSPPQPPLGIQGRAIPPDEEEAYFRRKREYSELVATRERQMEEEGLMRESVAKMAEEERGLVREVVWDCAARGGEKWWRRSVSMTKRHFRETSTGSMGGGSGGSGSGGDKKERDHWKGYAFDALWPPLGNAGKGEKQGTCRFKDAAGGKILKCKYYPANGSGQGSYLVSAVEFKLPSSTGFHSHRRARSHSPRPGEGEDGGMGGGVGEEDGVGDGVQEGDGGKAKMGTLVVHNVGMEMLDLVISTNVGIFWRKWEGWVGERGAMGQ